MEPTELPIACTLTGADLSQRLADMRALGEASLIDAEVGGRQAVLRFREDATTRERLSAIVAAEQECCAFMGFELDGTTLTIDAPEGAEPVLEELVAAFAGARR